MRFVYALPALAASARIALPGSILGAVLVEILATGTGIGYLISRSISNSAYLQLWAALVVLSVVTAVLYTLLSALENATTARLMR
jgi:ABC-type nitrate/sulfonate/bicarbonate transport system permease component